MSYEYTVPLRYKKTRVYTVTRVLAVKGPSQAFVGAVVRSGTQCVLAAEVAADTSLNVTAFLVHFIWPISFGPANPLLYPDAGVAFPRRRYARKRCV